MRSREDRVLGLQYSPFGGYVPIRRSVADALRTSHQLDFSFHDVVLTSGAMAALHIALRLSWFRRRGRRACPLLARPPLVRSSGRTSARARSALPREPRSGSRCDHGGDIGAYRSRDAEPPSQSLRAELWSRAPVRLGGVIARAEASLGIRISLIADESHRDFTPSGGYHSASAFVDRALVVYSFGKYHFMQGQRLGYLAVSPRHPESGVCQRRLFAGRGSSARHPTSLMQRAVPRLLSLEHDQSWLLSWRGRFVKELSSFGYLVIPQGNDVHLRQDAGRIRRLRVRRGAGRRRLLALPAPIFHHKGYFRLSLTGTEGMLERALAVLEGARPGDRPSRSRGHSTPTSHGTVATSTTTNDCGSDRRTLRTYEGPAPPCCRTRKGGYRIIRDPLGINKLFWVARREGGVLFAARPRRLIDQGYPLGEVRSIPVDQWWMCSPRDTPRFDPRSVLRVVRAHCVGTSASRTSARGSGPPHWISRGRREGASIAEVFVCFSGGLDSSGIAALAREVVPQRRRHQLRHPTQGSE